MDEERTGRAIRRERFSSGPARTFLSSMAADERIFEADLAVDRAHVVMLAEQEIIDEDAAGAILDALAGLEAAGYDELPDAEDVHEAIESAVIDRAGTPGGRMHTARSRNDEVATCIRYRLREDVLEAAAATIALRSALLDVARAHRESVMPGHTHLQPAQPTTVGHWACSYAMGLARDTARLRDAYGRVNRSPLGAAAFAGTPFPIDRDRTAALLGFDGVIENAMDAAASRDVLLEVAGTLTTLATTLSGLAADLILFAHRGYVDLDDDYASTSSIMPQKKNPDTLELVRATAGDASAGFAGLSMTLKGLPRAYNRDLQRATPHVWRAVDATTEASEVAAGAVRTATWEIDHLAADAGEGFTTATAVADRLAAAGLPFRDAHAVVATAISRFAEDASAGASLVDAIESELGGTDHGAALVDEIESDELRALLDPADSVASRDSRGGPAPAALEAQLDVAMEALQADRAAVADRRAALADAATALAREVGEYA